MRVLGSSVLGFEAIVVLLAMPLLAVNGYVDSMGVAFAIGGAIAMGLIVGIAIITRPGGVWWGWIMQGIVLALGFWIPTMWILGGIFALLWFIAVRTGGRIDRARAGQ